jgi:hypothetical protein
MKGPSGIVTGLQFHDVVLKHTPTSNNLQ